VIDAATLMRACDQQRDSDMHHEMVELRGRLRAVNIEHRRLLRERTSDGWFARMEMLRSERRALMAQIAGLQPVQIAAAGGHVPLEAVNQITPNP
jgi:hypothetical protein